MNFIKNNKKYWIWSVLLFLFFLVCPLIIYLKELQDSLLGMLVINTSYAVIVSCTAGTIFNIFLKDDISTATKNAVKEELDNEKNFQLLGLERVYSSPSVFITEMEQLIEESEVLYIVLNNGKNG